MRAASIQIALLTALAAPGYVAAQGFEAQAGRFYNEDGWNSYRLGFGSALGRSLTAHWHGLYMDRVAGADGALAGAGVDLSLFRGGRGGPYVIAGIDAGMGSETASSLEDGWAGWSAGAGWEVFPADFVAVGGEARYRQLSLGRRDGVELALGLRFDFGHHASRPPRPAQPSVERRPTGASDHTDRSGASRPTPAEPAGAEVVAAPPAVVARPEGNAAADATVLARAKAAPVTLTDSILATAAEMMGRRYQYGGTGLGGQGFDCSGLIQYAYSAHGIALPRRSVDQAREGRAVSRRVASLAPGDLLTFSNRKGRVTHVGMYVGDGEFIHSASRGVQVSRLSADDPYGRWWFKRWVGARRIAP